MFSIDILAVGKIKPPHTALFDTYKTRLPWPCEVHEIVINHKVEAKRHAQECEALLSKIKPDAFVVALDERGKSYGSETFATLLQSKSHEGHRHLQFILGGADGLNDEIRARSNLLLSFGQQTWPHMLARVMLMEQLYRAQSILSGHPYHRA